MITSDFIEILDEEDDEIEILEDFDEASAPNDIISLDRLFSKDDEIIVDAYEEDKKEEEIRQKKITKIQIGLIIFLIVFATLFYFFGYNLVEPYIKIE